MTTRLSPEAASVERFRADLARLCDVDEDTVLVGVSGGADSVALLLLAHAVLGERCRAATVDHGLRAEAAAEAASVTRLCAERGIAHQILPGTVPPRAGRTANVSARARLLRYRLLEEHARAIGARFVATGHHADDQLETLVMRLNRGAGVAGLSGIRARGGPIIRPLLRWRRDELAGLVARCGIAPVDDPANIDDRYDRARLRKVLTEVDWLDVEHVGVSARALGDAEEALAWTARTLEQTYCLFEDDLATLWPEGIPFELRRRLVERCLRHVDPDIEIRGPALVHVIDTLERFRQTTIGSVLCEMHFHRETGLKWMFSEAPPRRAT